MIKLTKHETEVFNAILATGSADAESIAYESSMSVVKTKSVLKDLIEKKAVYSFDEDGTVMFDITGETVQAFDEDATFLVQEDDAQAVPATESIEPTKKQSKPEKEQLDPNLFTKNGKPRKVTNAMKVREQISMLKATTSKEEAEMKIVQWCMETLGQSKQLAKTYFKDNWDKV